MPYQPQQRTSLTMRVATKRWDGSDKNAQTGRKKIIKTFKKITAIFARNFSASPTSKSNLLGPVRVRSARFHLFAVLDDPKIEITVLIRYNIHLP